MRLKNKILSEYIKHRDIELKNLTQEEKKSLVVKETLIRFIRQLELAINREGDLHTNHSCSIRNVAIFPYSPKTYEETLKKDMDWKNFDCTFEINFNYYSLSLITPHTEKIVAELVLNHLNHSEVIPRDNITVGDFALMGSGYIRVWLKIKSLDGVKNVLPY